MRTIKLMRVVAVFVLITCSFHSFSQLPCFDHIKIDKAALQKAKDYENNNRLNNSIQSASFVLRVFFHIVHCNDGTLPGAAPAQLVTEFNTLEAAYSGNNICFINAGYDNIYNTKLDTNFNADTDPSSLFSPYQVFGCINIFYLSHIDGTNGACAGVCGYGCYSFSIPGTVSLIANGNIGQGQTIAHEVGHCLGLLHTFEPVNGYEDINGNNSATAADEITDTPADPYAYIGQSCFDSSNKVCTYRGTCTDPNGATNFSPPYTNLMAYWWANGCYYSLALTSGQYTRVNSYLNTSSDLQNCESPSYATESNINISSGYLMASAINTLTTNSTVDISGNAVALLGGSMVTLEPGFDAYAYNGASVLVRLSQCSGTPNFAIAQTLKPVAVNNATNALVAYPNPASSTVTLVFTLVHNESKLLLRLYTADMKPVREISLQNLLKGKNKVSVNLSGLSSGVYSATIQAADVLLKVMIAVQK